MIGEWIPEPLTELYFECHITVEPFIGNDDNDFKYRAFGFICKQCDFRIANLLMQKRQITTPERSKYDTFATSRDTSYVKLHARMAAIIRACENTKSKSGGTRLRTRCLTCD